ncbi:hypothetical protein EDB89DRAFT_2005578 [Lactarius sanguifluus]|nr:hypothetical protein EDB89DRAFT_2005578 [Lactarius sanguifluus]
MSTFIFMLHFRRVRGRSSKCHFPHIQALVLPYHLRLRISALPAASAHGPPSKRTHSCPLLNSPAFLLRDMALPTVGALESSNPALIRLGARRCCPSLPGSRSASALLPDSRSTVRLSCRPTTLALRALQRRTALLRSMCTLSSLTLLAFDTELLAAAPGTLTHPALPHFVGMPPCSA